MNSKLVKKTRARHICYACFKQIKINSMARFSKWFSRDERGDTFIGIAYYHPKCWHRMTERKKRLEKLKNNGKCRHPETMIYMSYSPMLGESHLLEPDGIKCAICGLYI